MRMLRGSVPGGRKYARCVKFCNYLDNFFYANKYILRYSILNIWIATHRKGP